jgi:predicted DNA-binding WGR domain protein
MNDEQEPLFHQRLEYLGANHDNQGGQSDKFYEIRVDPDRLRGGYAETRKWGKFGANGQTKVIGHFSAAMAIRSAKNQLKKKAKKGYTKPIGALTRLATVAEDE